MFWHFGFFLSEIYFISGLENKKSGQPGGHNLK